MTQALMVLGSIVTGVGVILGVVIWLAGLTACDPFDPSEQC